VKERPYDVPHPSLRATFPSGEGLLRLSLLIKLSKADAKYALTVTDNLPKRVRKESLPRWGRWRAATDEVHHEDAPPPKRIFSAKLRK
jgi:hypothetical protein